MFRSSDTGTAGTGIEILGSFSARPLGLVALGSGLVAHLYDVGRGDPEAEPEVVAVTMSNQARPGQVKLQSPEFHTS